jgi:hypothetical protein
LRAAFADGRPKPWIVQVRYAGREDLTEGDMAMLRGACPNLGALLAAVIFDDLDALRAYFADREPKPCVLHVRYTGQTRITDDDIRIVFRACPNIELFHAKCASDISDTGVAHMSGHEALLDLRLEVRGWHGRITDAAWELFPRGLRRLAIGGERIRTVARAAQLRQLEFLELESISSARGISACVRLSHLWLRQSELADSDLREIAGLPRLQRLAVEGRRITAEGLRHIFALPLTALLLGKLTVKASDVPHFPASIRELWLGSGMPDSPFPADRLPRELTTLQVLLLNLAGQCKHLPPGLKEFAAINVRASSLSQAELPHLAALPLATVYIADWQTQKELRARMPKTVFCRSAEFGKPLDDY